MAGETRIQALLFDVFGTVVDWRSSVARELRPFLARYAPQLDAHEFVDAWRRRYKPAMAEIRSGRRPFVRLDVLHRENLEAALSDHGIAPGSIASAELHAINLAWHRIDPWPDSVQALRRLKQRYIVAPLSNGNIRLMLDMAKRAGLPWDAILGAELVQAYKPSPQVYTGAAEILGIRPEEICMVAAHNSDLAAARECGLKTAFVPRPTEYGPQQSTNLTAEQDWSFVAGDLQQLATALDCPA